MLPKSFNPYGCLDRDYEVTFEEIRHSLLIKGPVPPKPVWDSSWRETLLSNAEILVRQLWAVGITEVYLDGSFVTSESHPKDIDGCFECSFDDWNKDTLTPPLNAAAPKKVWSWSDADKRLVLGEKKLLMWCHYKVELYPYSKEFPGGIVAQDGTLVPFSDGFRLTKHSDLSKGLIKLKQDGGN